MEWPRQTFVVHVLEGGPRAVVENVASRERLSVADVREVGAPIEKWVKEERDDREPA
jgi:hypothetical protein